MQTRNKAKQAKQCIICRTDNLMRSGKIRGSLEKIFEETYCFGKLLAEGHAKKICPKCYFKVYDAVSKNAPAEQKYSGDLNLSDLPAFMKIVNENFVSTLQCVDIIRCKVVLEQIDANSSLDSNENCCELDSAPEQFDEGIQQDKVEQSKTSSMLNSSYCESAPDCENDDADDRSMVPVIQGIENKNIENVTNELSRLSVVTMRPNALTTYDPEVVNLVNESETALQLFEDDGVTNNNSCEMKLGTIHSSTRRLTSNSLRDMEIALDDSIEHVRWSESIRQSVAKLVTDSTVYIYGSQLYLNDITNGDVFSDLNLFIDFEKQYENAVSLAKMKIMKNNFENLLRNFPSEWKNVDGSCDNRIGLYPVLKAVDTRFGINCTFSFANGIFVEANKLLQEFIRALPIIRDVVNSLKAWQNKIGLFQFSTYQLTILALWYFQYRNHLPSVRALQTKLTRKNRKLCGGTLINISELPKVIEPISGSLNNVLADFFDIFGNEYEPSCDIICPFNGKMFRRHAQDDLDSENKELLNLIKNNANRLWNPPHAFMYVSDIFKHPCCCPNVMANVSKTAVETFTTQCRKMLYDFDISRMLSETSTI